MSKITNKQTKGEFSTIHLLQSLMRDYSILVSAYLLEGKTKSGTPRTTVPRNIAVPFSQVARAVQEPMIMSYDSYCLTNCFNMKETTPDRCVDVGSGGSDGSPDTLLPVRIVILQLVFANCASSSTTYIFFLARSLAACSFVALVLNEDSGNKRTLIFPRLFLSGAEHHVPRLEVGGPPPYPRIRWRTGGEVHSTTTCSVVLSPSSRLRRLFT